MFQNFGNLHINIGDASWLHSILFWVLKAVYGLLATLDSVGIISFHIMTSETKNRRKKALETAVNEKKYLREIKMYGP